MSEAAQEMYQLNEDELIREQCRAREEYYRREQRKEKRMRELEEAFAEKEKAFAEQRDMYQRRIQELEAQLANK